MLAKLSAVGLGGRYMPGGDIPGLCGTAGRGCRLGAVQHSPAVPAVLYWHPAYSGPCEEGEQGLFAALGFGLGLAVGYRLLQGGAWRRRLPGRAGASPQPPACSLTVVLALECRRLLGAGGPA